MHGAGGGIKECFCNLEQDVSCLGRLVLLHALLDLAESFGRFVVSKSVLGARLKIIGNFWSPN